MDKVLRLLLISIIVYVPNQTQFPAEFEVKGLNIINVLMLLTLFAGWLQREKLRAMSASMGPVATPLAGSFKFIFGVLVLSYCIGQVYDSSEWANDLTALKNIILFMLIYFLFFHSVRDLKTIQLLFGVILFVTFMASFQGLRQALDYGIASYNDTRRVAAPFGWSYTNANRSAVFFTIFLPLFAAVGLFYKARTWVRAVAFGCLGLGIFVIFFTYSRQAYFIVALLALLLTLRKSIFITVLVAIALATFPYWAPETAVARLESTTQGEQTTATSTAPPKEGEPEGKYDESTESRFIIWEGAAQLIAERPWGIGLNHFKREIGTYAPRYKGMDAHNNYVLFTTEAGILGTISMLNLLIGLILLGRRVEKSDDTEHARILGVGFTFASIAVCLGSIYGSRFFDGDVMGNFWALAALAARYSVLPREARVVSPSPAMPAPPPREGLRGAAPSGSLGAAGRNTS
jgi:O-antigen ligase